MRLDEMVVVVTGAGRGIGRAFAAGFCRDGARVVGIGRSEAALRETAQRHGVGRMEIAACDVGRTDQVRSAFADILSRHGRIDVLVNNAALYPKQPFLADFDVLEQAIRVNVTGLAACCREVLPGMLDRGFGRVINVGSYAWKNPIPNSSAYAASKAAVHVLTAAIAREVDRARFPDVLVNELLPGIYQTGMSDEGDDPAAAYPHARALVMLERGGPSGEVFLKDRMEPRCTARGGWRAAVRRLVRR